MAGATALSTVGAPQAHADFPQNVTVTPAGPVAPGTTVTYDFSCTPTDGDQAFVSADAAILGEGSTLPVQDLGDLRYRFTYSGATSKNVLLACQYEIGRQGDIQRYQVLGAPSTPPIGNATPASMAVTVTWGASADDGGQQPTYELQSRVGDGLWAEVASTQSLSATVSGLTNGTTYEFRVRAVNGGGASDYSASVFATPTILTATTSATFTGLDGGPIITGDDLRATVTVAGSGAIPTGTVTIFGIGPECQDMPVQADGTATCVVGTPPPGTYQISYSYSGDAVYSPVPDGSASVVVNPVPTAIELTNASTGPFTVGDEVELRATVTQDGAFPTTGTVRFEVDGETLCAVPVAADSGTAEAVCRTDELPAGSNEVTATFTGGDRFAPSTSNGVRVDVARLPLTLTLATVVASDGTVTATATAADGATPSSAGFLVDGITVPGCESAPFDEDGTAVCIISGIPAGAHEVSAVVEADALYVDAAATSTVTIAAPASPAPSNPAPSNPSPSNPAAPAPVGTTGATGAGTASVGGLPRTGGDAASWLLGLALLLVAAGAAPVVARRVRQG
ncbi:hypothetical protein GCM10009846_28860 [Agrococcus versicolor]|uniref:Fibronectin type-III domain-containing protein n=1 Tax=Agrococcus versicolor TaxID=501482 RepID=A0ABN3AXT1_9MICO